MTQFRVLRAGDVNIHPPLLFHNQWAKLVIAAKTTYKSSRAENVRPTHPRLYISRLISNLVQVVAALVRAL